QLNCFCVLVTVTISEWRSFFITLKNMETPCAGNNNWFEGVPQMWQAGIGDGESVNDNLDFLVILHYGRNLDYTG
ncbi:hypothetical protein J4G24_17335, partial [Clostridioides difficile]|nr:hypothetical protein [Clostridioides difficile]